MAYEAPALALEGAHIYAGSRLLLPEVDLTVPEGSHVAISGASGSGKSTLLKILAGFPPPSTGQLLFRGTVIGPNQVGRMRDAIAYVPQLPTLPAGLQVLEYLREPFDYHRNRGATVEERWIEERAESLRLPPRLLLQGTDKLSGGEKHRLMLLRGLLLERQIFFLDEVSASLDPASRKASLDLLRDSGATVIAVSHTEEWIGDADYHYEIRAARLVSLSREGALHR